MPVGDQAVKDFNRVVHPIHRDQHQGKKAKHHHQLRQDVSVEFAQDGPPNRVIMVWIHYRN